MPLTIWHTLAAWFGGLSLSWVLCCLVVTIIVQILRRKGYAVRLGFSGLKFRARPGSRRFPQGVQVRVSTRLVGFVFSGCRGPWLDISSEQFTMRLRGDAPPQDYRRVSRYLSIDKKYWKSFCKQVFQRLALLFIRGVRVRASKVRVWKDGTDWEFSADTLVIGGSASGFFDSKYTLSLNELLFRFLLPTSKAPVRVSCTRGIEVSAILSPRLTSLLFSRRHSVLDDIRLTVDTHDLSVDAVDGALRSVIKVFKMNLSPRHSRAHRNRLPKNIADAQRRHVTSVIRAWEIDLTVSDVMLRFEAPSRPPPSFCSFLEESDATTGNSRLSLEWATDASKNQPEKFAAWLFKRTRGSSTPASGLFIRFDHVYTDAFGVATQNRTIPAFCWSVLLHGCSIGSLNVDELSHELFERKAPPPIARKKSSRSRRSGSFRRRRGRSRSNIVEPEKEQVPKESQSNSWDPSNVDCLEKIVEARPEMLLWMDEITGVVDMGMNTDSLRRAEFGASGIVTAFEALGIASLLADTANFIKVQFPRRQNPAATEMESFSSLDSSSDFLQSDSEADLRRASDDEVEAAPSESKPLQLTVNLRHCRVLFLCRGSMGDGDTQGLIVTADSIGLPGLEYNNSSNFNFEVKAEAIKLVHWSHWARVENIVCNTLRCVVVADDNPGPCRKLIGFAGLNLEWDIDLHAALVSTSHLVAILKNSAKAVTSEFSKSNPRSLSERKSKSRSKNEPDTDTNRLVRKVKGWELSASDLRISSAFPDGPSLSARFDSIPQVSLIEDVLAGEGMLLNMCGDDIGFLEKIRVLNPLYTMSRSNDRRKVEIEGEGFRGVLTNQSQFGSVIQDWLLRIKAVIRLFREESAKNVSLKSFRRRMPTPDVIVRVVGVKLFYEDHPLAAFFSEMIPLFQDECRNRISRHQAMLAHLEQLGANTRVEVAGTAIRCLRKLGEKDSEVWIHRVKQLKEMKRNRPKQAIEISGVPLTTWTADELSFGFTIDEETRHSGISESLRKLQLFDEYQLGPRKRKLLRQYEVDAWNQVGFRNFSLNAVNLVIALRDFPDPFLKLTKVRLLNSIIGQAQQATTAPYYCSTSIALGRSRLANITKALSSSKMFMDIHIDVEHIICHFNPAQLGSIGDFGRTCARFSSNGKNPSPRVPWFDSVRSSCHGRLRLTTKVLTGTMASSNSPYTKTKDFVNIESKNVRLVFSRMKPTTDEPFPISFDLHNMHIRPNGGTSDIGFEHVCVGLTPVPECDSGDPQDHYFIPFASKAAVRKGGPGIGKGVMDIVRAAQPAQAELSPLGCYTNWTTGVDDIPDFDSYRDYKTRRMTLGIDVSIRHPRSRMRQPDLQHEQPYVTRGRSYQYGSPEDSWIPPQDSWIPFGTSVLHSDAISILVKVIKILINRPISCRLAPRMIDRARKPPSITGFSSSLVALNLTVNVADLNVAIHNNVNPGHGILVSTDHVAAVLEKRTDIIWKGLEYDRHSRVSRRKVEVTNVDASIRVPELDLAGDSAGVGRLLTVSRIFLSDDAKDEPEYAASPRLQAHSRVFSTGFGSTDEDKSPFYTFSASHAFQREKKLDKVKYDMRIAVDDVRLLWSPDRRTSLWAWPDAFKEKSFAMKAPPVIYNQTFDASETEITLSQNKQGPGPPTTPAAAARRPSGTLLDILADDNEVKRGEVKREKKVLKPFSECVSNTLATIPKYEFLINSAQVCIGSPETAGLVFLTSDAARIGIIEKSVHRPAQVGSEGDNWTDKEHRVHLKESNVYCQSTDLKTFNYGAPSWLPPDAHRRKPKDIAPITRVTTRPMSMDLLYISSFSGSKDASDDEDDYATRPSLLFINVRDISMASTSVGFSAVTDVVRKVLMQRNASSMIVKDELARLRLAPLTWPRKLTSWELEEKARQLNTITRQFLYAADTSQHHLVDGLLFPNTNFEDSMLKYKAKAKAVATFVRTDHRASQAEYQYPTMYISYSFDHCSWELRELQENEETIPIVEISLADLVCRHIFYVGRGSSAEITFKSISATNKMHNSSHFVDFLKPGGGRADISDGQVQSIKSSDGCPVAFRWFSTQTDRVGGISIYDLLTIQVAPLNAAVSRRLYNGVYKFIFPPNDPAAKGMDESGASSARSSHDSNDLRPKSRSRANSFDGLKKTSSRVGRDRDRDRERDREDVPPVSDVTLMAARSNSTILFKYVFIDTFELTASFKNKEKDRSMLDFSNLFVTTPSFSYSSEIWTWKDFAQRIKRDLVYTFARRGVSNLAKIKFIPGYSRAKRKLFQGAGTVHRSIANLRHKSEEPNGNASDSSNDSRSNSDDENEPVDETELQNDEEHRTKVLRVLYGHRAPLFTDVFRSLN